MFINNFFLFLVSGFQPAKFANIKRGLKLISNGYIYGREQSFKNKTYWRCIRRFKRCGPCKVRAFTLSHMPGLVKLINGPHNHEPNEANSNVQSNIGTNMVIESVEGNYGDFEDDSDSC